MTLLRKKQTKKVDVVGLEVMKDPVPLDSKVPDTASMGKPSNSSGAEGSSSSKHLGKFSFARSHINTTDQENKIDEQETHLNFCANEENSEKVLEFKLEKKEENKLNFKPQTQQADLAVEEVTKKDPGAQIE